MSKLLKLQSIKIECPEDIDKQTEDILPFITDSGLIHVINNCEEMNSIMFFSGPNISHKTIDALIALALRKARIYFKHRFDDIEKEYNFFEFDKDISFTAIHLKIYKLPNNLVIN